MTTPLPYDMGNAGDLVKHGLLAEFTQWWCLHERRPIRFLDPFSGRPCVSPPNPEVTRRVRALPPCALRDAQLEPATRYCGSAFVVKHAARAVGSSAEVSVSDSDPEARQAFDGLALCPIVCPGFSPQNGFSILDAEIEADLVLLDPFAKFLKEGAPVVIPRIADAAKRFACVLFVLNLNPDNPIGRRYCRLRSEYLPTAWSLNCPKLPDHGIRGESHYEVDVLLAWCRLSDHPWRDELRKRLQRYAASLTMVLATKIAFSAEEFQLTT